MEKWKSYFVAGIIGPQNIKGMVINCYMVGF